MERYADRVRRLVLILVLITSFSVTFGQNTNTGSSGYYGHFNIGLSANESKFNADSLPSLTYDFGVGANFEYEIFFTDKLSVLGGAGISYLKSSTTSKSFTAGLIAADFRVAPKYSINGRIHVIAGPTVLYKIKSEVKTSYLDRSWSSFDYMEEFQYGGFAGLELYLNDWSALRSLAIIRSHSVTFELAFIITPELAGL